MIHIDKNIIHIDKKIIHIDRKGRGLIKIASFWWCQGFIQLTLFLYFKLKPEVWNEKKTQKDGTGADFQLHMKKDLNSMITCLFYIYYRRILLFIQLMSGKGGGRILVVINIWRRLVDRKGFGWEWVGKAVGLAVYQTKIVPFIPNKRS